MNFITLSLLALLMCAGCVSTAADGVSPTGVRIETLARSTSSWDGTSYATYPPGQPEITVLKLTIAPHTTMQWHLHPMPNAAYVLSGELTIEKRDGTRRHFVAGEVISETVGSLHRGISGADPVVLVVFYAGTQGLPLSQQPPISQEVEYPESASTKQLMTPFSIASAIDRLQPLIETSARRLVLAKQVALAKWDTQTPVEDPLREAQVITAAANEGESRGLNRTFVSGFFAAQIEANKLVQYSLLAHWHRAGGAPKHPLVSLTKDIRPQLDQVEAALIAELVETADIRTNASCRDETAKAIGKYVADRRPGALMAIALDRAMAANCSRLRSGKNRTCFGYRGK